MSAVDHIAWQLARSDEAGAAPALIWRDRTMRHDELRPRCAAWRARLIEAGVAPGAVVALIADYSPSAVAALLALVERRCIVVPLSAATRAQEVERCRLAEVEHTFTFGSDDEIEHQRPAQRRDHTLLARLRDSDTAGLILFTSGSSGEPKAIVHALPQLLAKFRTPRRAYRTVSFLLLEHIGGLNTLLHTLANAGCLVVPRARTVDQVAGTIARHRVELLPTTPSFLNFMLLERAAERYDLSSLVLVSYGTERMPEHTLRRARAALPGARFHQTYGLSELGILRSRSAASGSLLVQLGGEGYETRVVDGTLRIRARSSMLGYLNAPSPFDGDGWFDTGDAVVVHDGFLEILGRRSELINVGGQKVHPTEIERVLALMPGVVDVAVHGEANLLLGQVVVAELRMAEPIEPRALQRQVSAWARARLPPYMVPVRVRPLAAPALSPRGKRLRP
jgi:acyl-CoA synthetase (AMP-forming)/AMP-acid ligase II